MLHFLCAEGKGNRHEASPWAQLPRYLLNRLFETAEYNTLVGYCFHVPDLIGLVCNGCCVDFQPNLSADLLELETSDTGCAGGVVDTSGGKDSTDLKADNGEIRAASVNDAALNDLAI